MRQAGKPWQKIGMGRATWYRHGKPTTKLYRMTQQQAAVLQNVSLRSVQRASRVLRLAPDLAPLIDSGKLKLGPAEEEVKSRAFKEAFQKMLDRRKR